MAVSDPLASVRFIESTAERYNDIALSPIKRDSIPDLFPDGEGWFRSTTETVGPVTVERWVQNDIDSGPSRITVTWNEGNSMGYGMVTQIIPPHPTWARRFTNRVLFSLGKKDSIA